MDKIPHLTEKQKNFLFFLYDKKSPMTKSELQAYSLKHPLSEISSLIDENPNLVRTLGKNSFNESFEITSEGKAVVEAIRKQHADELYQRDLDRRSIEIAEQANAKSDKSNLIAILSAVFAGLSILADIILAFFLNSN